MHERWTKLVTQPSYNCHAHFTECMRVEQNWSLNSHTIQLWCSFDRVHESWAKLITGLSYNSHGQLIKCMRAEENCHLTLIQHSCSFDRVHESWTNLVTQLSYNSHARLTECMTVEQNWSLDSPTTLIVVWSSAWELKKTAHSTLIQLLCSFDRVHKNWTKLVTQFQTTLVLVWPSA